MTTSRAVPGLVIGVLVAVALSSVAVTVVGLQHDPAPARIAEPPPAAEPRPELAAAEVLAAWDAERAAAWADGDVRRLRTLYASGSVAGRRDVAMLRSWLDRGLVVRDLRTQVLALHEVSRSPDRWVLAVTDRVVGGTANGVALPVDAPSARTIVLRQVDGEWRVASVAG